MSRISDIYIEIERERAVLNKLRALLQANPIFERVEFLLDNVAEIRVAFCSDSRFPFPFWRVEDEIITDKMKSFFFEHCISETSYILFIKDYRKMNKEILKENLLIGVGCIRLEASKENDYEITKKSSYIHLGRLV